jgi:hypothetical protein
MYWTRPEGEARSGAQVRPPSGTMEAPAASEVSPTKTTTMASATPAAGPSGMSEDDRCDAD